MQLDELAESGLVRYVGLGQWTLLWLPGRTVSEKTARAAVCAAETLRHMPPPDDDQGWSVIREGAERIGFTLREFQQSLAITCDGPSAPPVPRRNALWWLRFQGRR